MNRRRFLAGLGGALAAAALPRRARGQGAVGVPKRLILVMHNNGVQQGGFWPSDGFTSPSLEPLLGDARLASATTLVRGVHIPDDTFGTDGNEHDVGFARLWTGQPLLSVAGHPWGGGPSVDQIVARARDQASLTLAVYASTPQPFPKPGFQNRRSFCYVAPGVHKLPILDPFTAYARLFGAADGTSPAVLRRLALRKSALDAVAGDLASLRGRLAPSERARLDAHAESLREMEQRLSDLLSGRPVPGASCPVRGEAPPDYQTTAPEKLVNDESAIPDLIRSHIDIIVSALACDLTSVATLQLGYAGGMWLCTWLGLSINHHDLAHMDYTDAGPNPYVRDTLIRINRFYASQLAYLARKLDAIPAEDGTLLDHTLIVCASEIGRGDHSMKNLPVVLIGGAGGALPTGGRVVDAGEQPFQRLGCTVLRAMDVPVDGFGDLPACGPLAGLFA